MEQFLKERKNANCTAINNFLDHFLEGSHFASHLRIQHQQKIAQRAETRCLSQSYKPRKIDPRRRRIFEDFSWSKKDSSAVYKVQKIQKEIYKPSLKLKH